jgi:mannose-6-phosphate isomerase-like protein (cupin superfamily)
MREPKVIANGVQPTRREMVALMTAFAAVMGVEGLASAAGAQEPAAGTLDLAHSRVIRFADLPETRNANGGWTRSVGHGVLPSGEPVELHHSMLPPGKMPHRPHQHSNSEFIVLREGSITYMREGGYVTVNVGDVIYTASLQPHGMYNQGAAPAIYFVLSVGKAGQAAFVDLKPPV